MRKKELMLFYSQTIYIYEFLTLLRLEKFDFTFYRNVLREYY
jgi:hypothetical protein